MLVLNALMINAIKKICLSNWIKHITSTCDHRPVQCPAIKCKVTGTPNDVVFTLSNVRFTLFGAPAVELIGSLWQLDITVKKVKNKINL